MRILHGTANPGGMAGVLAKAQRQLGQVAWSVSYARGNFAYECDQVMDSSIYRKPIAWTRFLLEKMTRFDVYHFYFGESLLGPSLWDVPLLKHMGKKVFFYFCGCDIRDSKHVIETYARSACQHCWPLLCSRNRPRARELALRHADGIFVSTPDLMEFVPGARLMPQPIDLERFDTLLNGIGGTAAPGRPGVDRPVRIAHAPSNRTIKGTAHIEAAVERLRRRGINLELVLIENQTYANAMATTATCDLGVDKVLVGAYGQCAVEMMALGKPTLCHIRDDLAGQYPAGCPIIRAGVKDLEAVLADWVRHPERWPEAGRRGRAYVQKYHDKMAVAARCLQAYRKGT